MNASEQADTAESVDTSKSAAAAETLILRVYGVVQGVGFRPFVARTARALGLRGTVANRGSFVEICAQGEEPALARLQEALQTDAPERAAVLHIESRRLRARPMEGFAIIESVREWGAVFVSPDIAVCPQCEAELFDPQNRRYHHPFINCTACGPRLSILEAMPYDRERTSMKMFPMCRACAQEYRDPSSRRYDAQPVCCPDCGPQVYLLEKKEAQFRETVRGGAAIEAARAALMAGRIVAVKGIGGFHLCCDARNDAAVRRLRERKNRPAKPFAVMLRDWESVCRECAAEPAARVVLTGHEKPIVLLEKRMTVQRDISGEARPLSEAIAPDNPKLGVMLPYTPLHLLLLREGTVEVSAFAKNRAAGECGAAEVAKTPTEMPTVRGAAPADTFCGARAVRMTDALVVTSGNVSGAPIVTMDEEATSQLAGFCDLILSHDRAIYIRADDSVADWYDGAPYMIRRSRGYAPLSVWLREAEGTVLALGGELKSTFCVGRDELLYPSPYVGDAGDLRTVQALRQTTERLCRLLEAEPEVIACDLHPDYNTAALARELAAQRGARLLLVQHHFAHVLSCMAENGVPAGRRVIGVAFDGVGYGTDGAVWGGEFLLADYGGFARLGSIAPSVQAGGDSASREGWKIAVSMALDWEKKQEKTWKTEGEKQGNAGTPAETKQGADSAEESAETKQGADSAEEPAVMKLGAQEDIEAALTELGLCTSDELRLLRAMRRSGLNCVRSTSAGRLFDAVSAILGLCRISTYEGEAAARLQFAAEAALRRGETGKTGTENSACPGTGELETSALSVFGAGSQGAGDWACFGEDSPEIGDSPCFDAAERNENKSGAEPFVLPTGRLVRQIFEAKRSGGESGALALFFHRELAKQIAWGCVRSREQTGCAVCALTGGVFQNTLLLRLTEQALRERGFTVLRHHLVPPNDGGLALGQAAAAMYAGRDFVVKS